ncbi:TPA: hypothetical protein HA251_04645 [Candidatus Woesearchaeota archaeon]|nr:hypothetical protein [Candidatus Woesearchaeota archaeon]
MTRWFDIRIPKFYVDNKPDFARIGERIDICLKRHFLGRNVAVRVLGSQEHSGKSVDDLITIIKRLGHDRYDPDRTGDRYENIDGKRIDFFALDFKVTAPGRYFERFIEPFYFWPIASREVPVRVDIAIIYDRNKLTRVLHRYKGRENEPKRDGFVFKNADDASSAIIGIIKIDR